MASPCIDICRYDEATGFCLGCGMLKPEKKRWKKDRDQRPAIRAALPDRLSTLQKAGLATGKAAKRKKG
ncbi:DUF1289 domain-containing protein [Falsiroseomonas sp. E2-1-a20]|uniref:DUF1289 domain-containing protein n=1 Tax=Falsiroseomonas sp. E2-1-a20 TaxID=3239300 RepID=UPI003F2BF072